ncbi:hypothetical protein ACHAXA_005045 [Cyclostephanos tholiformis]|uniref:Mitochondrial splicing suppressor 51-like C-terminal domain-containing protein n=1 Tax=Cyclostephanos tholiformis TaxID=382380 RepID=A0ABD3SRR0_9STRA
MHGDEYDRRDDVGKAVVGEGGRRTTSIVACTIDFVGPDVPRGLMTRTIDLSLTNDIDEIEYEDADGRMGGGNNDDEATVYRLVMNYHPSFLHEVVLGLRNSSSSPGGERTEKTVEEGAGGMTTKVTPMLPWDGYALFNPGLGHPNLRGMWHQTLKFLLRTDKPMLITAHSIIDASRDREVLEETITADDDGSSFCCSELPLVYDDNPYASRMGFVDPFYSPADQMGKGWDSVGTENAHHGVIHPNHSVLFLRRALSTDG